MGDPKWVEIDYTPIVITFSLLVNTLFFVFLVFR